tara:strand:+ start:395 stop:595 length:201 start_codon:yes stop_codon:yes gene_type:complete
MEDISEAGLDKEVVKNKISYALYHVEACMINNHKDIKRKLESYHKERERLELIREDIIKEEKKKYA